ncbi:hypothetical protein [Hyalangium gracile]|uniref:hypothetical protein n=1 Tax=Hyalangium gracile TaxID=394092 RepID=UPI001CCCF26B|nr:hypothetical protein [Hyalangium gracile]
MRQRTTASKRPDLPLQRGTTRGPEHADAASKWSEARWMGEVATSARVVVRCNSLLSVVAAAAAGGVLG